MRIQSDADWATRLYTLRTSLGRRQFTDTWISDTFALIGACCKREFGLVPFDQQFTAARIMLDNQLVEMATGEGKTVAAMIAAATAALAGVPVHVITSNDYLAARDAQAMSGVYNTLGLRVGIVTQNLDAAQRRAAYACNITYCTAKELVFDYLRDTLLRRGAGTELEQRADRLDPSRARPPVPVLRGLCMAIIDEADSILIDEAKVPLVLSQSQGNPAERSFYEHALRLANGLEVTTDYYLETRLGSASLTDAGRAKIDSRTAATDALTGNRRYREEAVCLALMALHQLAPDRDYLVRDGRVMVIEPTTGRVAPGRMWSRGLQQLLELKEGCAMSAQPVTVAQITYQRFFPRYLRLCGLSGTAAEARGELATVYGLGVVRVPLRTASRRVSRAPRLYWTDEARWSAVASRCAQAQRAGQPVLIGTDSVADSERLSRRLTAAGVTHVVLNARHDAHEAQIVAAAGSHGQVTVATNMAGRGTDIALGPGVAELGGLLVILCQFNPSRRIDRQFLGRCARRGEPGVGETLLALDALPMPAAFGLLVRLCKRGDSEVLPSPVARWLVATCSWLADRQQRAQREALRKQDAEIERRLMSLGAG